MSVQFLHGGRRGCRPETARSSEHGARAPARPPVVATKWGQVRPDAGVSETRSSRGGPRRPFRCGAKVASVGPFARTCRVSTYIVVNSAHAECVLSLHISGEKSASVRR